MNSLKIVLALALALCASKAMAIQQNDGSLDTGNVNVYSNGNRQYTLGSQPALDDSLRVMQASSPANGSVAPYSVIVATNGRVGINADKGKAIPSPMSGLDVGPGNGSYFAVHLASQTATSLGLIVPGQVGELIFNSTTGRVCVSTGSNQGAFAAIGSTSAIVNNQAANQVPCWGLGQ